MDKNFTFKTLNIVFSTISIVKTTNFSPRLEIECLITGISIIKKIQFSMASNVRFFNYNRL